MLFVFIIEFVLLMWGKAGGPQCTQRRAAPVPRPHVDTQLARGGGAACAARTSDDLGVPARRCRLCEPRGSTQATGREAGRSPAPSALTDAVALMEFKSPPVPSLSSAIGKPNCTVRCGQRLPSAPASTALGQTGRTGQTWYRWQLLGPSGCGRRSQPKSGRDDAHENQATEVSILGIILHGVPC